MHVFGAFELDIPPGTPDDLGSIRVALLRYVRGEDGRLSITPECTSFEEVEGQLNSLQTNWTRSAKEPAEPSKLPNDWKWSYLEAHKSHAGAVNLKKALRIRTIQDRQAWERVS
jgi:hypothetical protein